MLDNGTTVPPKIGPRRKNPNLTDMLDTAAAVGVDRIMFTGKVPMIDRGQHELGGGAVMQVGRENLGLEQQTLRVDHKMALAAVDLLAPAVAARAAAHLGGLDRLAVDDRRGGLSGAAHPLARAGSRRAALIVSRKPFRRHGRKSWKTVFQAGKPAGSIRQGTPPRRM